MKPINKNNLTTVSRRLLLAIVMLGAILLAVFLINEVIAPPDMTRERERIAGTITTFHNMSQYFDHLLRNAKQDDDALSEKEEKIIREKLKDKYSTILTGDLKQTMLKYIDNNSLYSEAYAELYFEDEVFNTYTDENYHIISPNIALYTCIREGTEVYTDTIDNWEAPQVDRDGRKQLFAS